MGHREMTSEMVVVVIRPSLKETSEIVEIRRELKGVSPEGVRRYFLSKKVFLCFKKVLEGKRASKKASETF